MGGAQKKRKKLQKGCKNAEKRLDRKFLLCYNYGVKNKRIGKGGLKSMSTVRVGENENVESALRRFKRKCSRDGIIGDLRKKEFYEKPSVRRKKKSEAARKRSRN